MPKYVRSRGKRRAGRRGRRTLRRGRARLSKKVAGVKAAIQGANGYTMMNTVRPRAHFFKRSIINAQSITQGSATQSYQNFINVSLSSFPNFAEFQALYDRYKITKLKFTFKLVDAAQESSEQLVMYAWKNNSTNDSVGSINTSYVAQQEYVRRYQFSPTNREFSLSIYPYWLSRVYVGVTDGYAENNARKSAWLDIDYPGIVHYGLGYFIPSTPGNLVSPEWRIDLDVEASFMFMSMS